MDEYGQGQLPKKAERVYGKPGKTDLVGHYIDARTGEVETVAYRLPEPKKAGKPADGTRTTPGARPAGGDGDDMPTVRTRPDVTQKGVAMIGDLRTDALHQALADTPIEDETLLGLLILAFGGDNVSVDSGSDLRGDDRQAICRTHHRRRRADGRPRPAAPGGAPDADRRAVLSGEPLAERTVRPHRRRGDRRLAAPAEHGDRGVPVVRCRGARWRPPPGRRASTSHPARRTRGRA